MRIDKTTALIISPLLAGMLVLAGCGQKDATTASSQSSPPATTMGQKVDDAASKIADKATSAADKVATATDDSAITAKVKAAIVAEPGLKSMDISVDTKDATVTLTGTVASADLRDRAKQVATNTSGVKGVVDNLSVKA